jgi:hypothetical protein
MGTEIPDTSSDSSSVQQERRMMDDDDSPLEVMSHSCYSYISLMWEVV